MPILTIDTYEAKYFAGKLRTMKRSAFPSAIRETLSKSALHVKQKTMPKAAQDAFVNRSKNFFKYNSTVDFAKGYDINTMQSTVGFIENRLKGQNNYSVKDLEQQEQGGTITNRSLLALDSARTGKSRNRLVMQKNRVSSIRRIVKVKSGNGKMGWMKAAYMSKKLYGDNAYVLGAENAKGFRTLSRIDSVTRIGRNTVIKRTALYSVDKGHNVRVNKTGFMRRASFESQSIMDKIFVIEAHKQIKRLIK
jgi:hypothetical protein